MIRATELSGRAVIDMEAAERLGRVERVILDFDARRVAGFVVSRGSSLMHEGTHLVLPATAVHAVGPDAITVRGAAIHSEDTARLDGLPRVGDLIGRKVVSFDGRMLGTVDDVLLNGEDGRIIGYTLADPDVLSKLQHLVSGDSHKDHQLYLRADANLRTGKDLIIAPDDAVTRDWGVEDAEPREGAMASPGNTAFSRWRTARDADWAAPRPRAAADDGRPLEAANEMHGRTGRHL